MFCCARGFGNYRDGGIIRITHTNTFVIDIVASEHNLTPTSQRRKQIPRTSISLIKIIFTKYRVDMLNIQLVENSLVVVMERECI